MNARSIINNTVDLLPSVAEMALRNPKVALDLLPSAMEGFILEEGKEKDHLTIQNKCPTNYNWSYEDMHEKNEFSKIYSVGKRRQWNADDLAWDTDVDPLNLEKCVIPEQLLPMYGTHLYPDDKKSRGEILHSAAAWLLSQLLHGEQGALHVSCQTVEVNPGVQAKLYGSTQVMDEARHVEVFYRYLDEKLNKLYNVDDNLFTILHHLNGTSEWDLKFLGMQIMVEGLALGVFSIFYKFTKEPLMKELLRGVIADEARHVHYGVAALRDFYTKEAPEALRREREDWAYEVAVLLRNRFMFKEIYEEYFAHKTGWKEWENLILDSNIMQEFRLSLFSRLVPNLKRIGLLTDRMRDKYAKLGILQYENEKSADRLTLEELLGEEAA